MALLLLAALAPETAVAQRTPQPIFTELFAYDPTESLAVAGEVTRAITVAMKGVFHELGLAA